MAKLTAIQMVSTPDVDDNFSQLENQLASLDRESPQLVVVPECFVCFGGRDNDLLELAKKPSNNILERLQTLAQRYQCWLIAGTIPVLAEDGNRFRAASFCIDEQGAVRGRYDKIHLFDVDVGDATGTYLESRHTEPGDSVVLIESPFGKIGMAVCYDVRFAGLFQAMQEADVLVLPSAFTQRTGEAHWHALLRARAIEMQSYVIGANQGGIHPNGRETFGNSCVYSPWGELLSCLDKGPGVVSATFDNDLIASIRQRMPIRQHTKFRSYFERIS